MISMPQTAVAARYRGREYRLSAWLRDTGDDLVLFVHGLGCSKESWRQAWSSPALYGCSLLAIDLPGFGASPRPTGFSYDLEDQAGLLAGVIDAYASRRVCLVAHSMGGAVAMLLPAASARRIDRLVLVEARLSSASCGIASLASSASLAQFEAEVFPQFRRRVELDRRAAFDLDRADRQAFYLSSKSLVRWTGGTGLAPRFDAFDCPKVFVYGGDNRHLHELALIDRSLLREIADAGHFAMNDNPEAFYALVARLSAPQGADE